MPISDPLRYRRPEGLSPDVTQWATVREWPAGRDRGRLLWTVEMVTDLSLPEDLRPDARKIEDVMHALFIDYEDSWFDMAIGDRYRLAAFDSLTPEAEGYLRWADTFTYVGGPSVIGAMVPVR